MSNERGRLHAVAFWVVSSAFIGVSPASTWAVEEQTPAKEHSVAGELLRARCFGCHGPKKQSGKLRLDSMAAMLRGGRKGPALVPGKSKESLLFERVQPDAEKRMPPEGKGKQLDESELRALASWIDSGASATVIESSAISAPEPVELVPGSLPTGFAPIYALAGDPTSARFAVGRGPRVEIHELREEEAEKGRGKQWVASRVRELPVHADLVQSLAFSRDGRFLASGEYRVVRVWNTETWKLIVELSGHSDRVLALVFSPDGSRLAAGSGRPTHDGEVRVWDLAATKLVWESTPHTDTVLALDWSSDGGRLLTGAADRVTHLLDASTGRSLRRLEGHTHHVLGVAFGPEGKQAATVGADSVLKLWDLESFALAKEQGKHGDAATSVAYFPDGKQIVTTCGDGVLRFFDTRNTRARRSVSPDRSRAGESLDSYYLQAGAFLAGGKQFAAAEQSGAVRVHETKDGKLLLRVEPAIEP